MESVQRKNRRCRKLDNISSEYSESTEDSSDSIESLCEKCKCSYQKKRSKDIQPEFHPMVGSTLKKHRASSKANKEICRKPLQERLKQKYSIPHPCNIICLCQSEIKRKYSPTTIRKVPPQPITQPKVRKLKKRLPRSNSDCTMSQCKPDECTQEEVVNKYMNISNCNTLHEVNCCNSLIENMQLMMENENKNKKRFMSKSQSKPDECMQKEVVNKNVDVSNCNTLHEVNCCCCIRPNMQFKMENENKNKKRFMSKTVMTDDYNAFECIQIEIESDDGSSCTCGKFEKRFHISGKQKEEKEVQTNISEDKEDMQSNAFLKVDEPRKDPQVETNTNVDTVQEKSTLLKRCLCFVKKRNKQKKPQNVLAKQENCDCKSNDSHLSITSRKSQNKQKKPQNLLAEEGDCDCKRNDSHLNIDSAKTNSKSIHANTENEKHLDTINSESKYENIENKNNSEKINSKTMNENIENKINSQSMHEEKSKDENYSSASNPDNCDGTRNTKNDSCKKSTTDRDQMVFHEPENIEIHIGKSNAKIIIIRDLD